MLVGGVVSGQLRVMSIWRFCSCGVDVAVSCWVSLGWFCSTFFVTPEDEVLSFAEEFVLSFFSLSPGLMFFFFHFIRRFWNHVFTCASFKPKICASFALLVESRYFCSEKVFSRTRSWRSVKTVRDLRHLRPLGVRRLGLTRKYTGRLCRTSFRGSVPRKKEENKPLKLIKIWA